MIPAVIRFIRGLKQMSPRFYFEIIYFIIVSKKKSYPRLTSKMKLLWMCCNSILSIRYYIYSMIRTVKFSQTSYFLVIEPMYQTNQWLEVLFLKYYFHGRCHLMCCLNVNIRILLSTFIKVIKSYLSPKTSNFYIISDCNNITSRVIEPICNVYVFLDASNNMVTSCTARTP